MTRTYKAGSILLTGILLATGAVQTKVRAADESDRKEVYDYVLTLDKIQKLDQATKALREFSKSHPELKGDRSGSKSFDERAQKIQQYPKAVALLAENGLSPREYLVGLVTVNQALMVLFSRQTGQKGMSPEMQKRVSPANLAFVEQHWDDIRKIGILRGPGQ